MIGVVKQKKKSSEEMEEITIDLAKVKTMPVHEPLPIQSSSLFGGGMRSMQGARGGRGGAFGGA